MLHQRCQLYHVMHHRGRHVGKLPDFESNRTYLTVRSPFRPIQWCTSREDQTSRTPSRAPFLSYIDWVRKRRDTDGMRYILLYDYVTNLFRISSITVDFSGSSRLPTCRRRLDIGERLEDIHIRVKNADTAGENMSKCRLWSSVCERVIHGNHNPVKISIIWCTQFQKYAII